MVNVVVAPDVYARDRAPLQSALVLVDGVLQRDHGAGNLVVQRIAGV